jgi:uncharacterized membrane protein (UPF0182 family)
LRLGRGATVTAAILAFVVLLIAGGAGAGFLSELLWYRSVQMEDVFWTHWRANLIVRGAAAMLIMGVVFLNLWIVTRSLGAIRVRRRYGNIEIAERLPQAYLFAAITAISLFSAWWLSGGLADPLPILAALNPVQWGLRDPAFGFDTAFYVFQLPVLNRLQTLASLVVFWIALLAIAAYSATGAIKAVDGKPLISRLARRHLGVLVAAFLLFYAVDVWLDRYGLVIDGNGFGGALGYTDVYARLPAKLFVIALVLITAGSVAYGAWVGNLKLALVSAILLPIALVGAEGVYPSSIQRFVVEPNEFPREEPFIEQQIAFTRAAFALQDVETVAMPYRTRTDFDEAELVERLEGIPLWDPRPLLTTYQAQQALFRYYTFSSVHHDRYPNNGGVEPVAVSVRELDTSELEPAAQTWQNLHLNYVSGAGAVASPVARMATNGTPIFYVWDLEPPKLAPEAPPELSLDDPRIYFGERSSEYIIIGPEHEPAGIPLDSWWRKALFAWSFRSNNILLSGDLTRESKIVFRRRVTERVQAVAPFLHVSADQGAYPVISDGRVVWVVDAYTTSATFPLSPLVAFETRGARYVRNSVKATVDAVTGEIQLYAIDTDDPILATYSAIFPGLVRPLNEMPATLRSHLRFPVQMMTIQGQVLGAYHLVDPRQFYEQQDVWSVATEQYRGTPATMEPQYSLFRLPDADSTEFLLSLPFVARGRQNMTALMVARNDPPNYGRQILYLMPRDEQVPGPQQIEAAIDQNPEISQQLALWLRGGSAVLRGHLVVVPLDGTLLYVEPLFLEAENAAIPQLERVILSQAGRVVMEPNFESAVAALVRGAESTATVRGAPDAADDADPRTAEWEPLTRAREILDEAEAMLRAGDWAGFGRALQDLREALALPTDGS